MTPRERAEALWEALQPPKFKQKPTLEELEAILNGPDQSVQILPSGEIMVGDKEAAKEAAISTIENAITEHVRALLAETPETMELLTYGPLDKEDARWTLAALRSHAGAE